jgi:hypothetical protein
MRATRRELLASAITGAGATFASTAFAQQVPQSAASSAGTFAQIGFSTLAGSTDDAKLATFCGAYANAAFKPTLVLDEMRAYTFSAQHQIFNGFAMIGGGSRALDQARSSNVLPQVVQLRQTALRGWLTLPGSSIWGLYLAGLSFDANSSSRLIHPNPSCVIWTSTFRDISYQNGPSLFGAAATKQPMDACVFDGFWNVNNITEQAFNIGGSDCRFTPQLLLLDSPPTFLKSSSAFLMQLNALSKTTLSNLYITAEQHSALQIPYGNSMLRLHHCDIEGRNASQPCYGALIVSSSSFVQLSDSWIAYGMSKPTATGRNDAGLIMVTGGRFEALNCHTMRATGVAESVPFLCATGASTKVVVRNIVGEGYTGRPVVRAINGAVADVDDSVTLVTS